MAAAGVGSRGLHHALFGGANIKTSSPPGSSRGNSSSPRVDPSDRRPKLQQLNETTTTFEEIAAQATATGLLHSRSVLSCTELGEPDEQEFERSSRQKSKSSDDLVSLAKQQQQQLSPSRLVQGVVVHGGKKGAPKKKSPTSVLRKGPWALFSKEKTTSSMGNPYEYLVSLLEERGYPTETVVALDSHYAVEPTSQQMHDYTMATINAVRQADLDALRMLHAEGHGMNACNKFAESLVHMAGRSGNCAVMEFLIDCTGPEGLTICDDYGRTPLHDACWATEPCFDLVSFILDHDSSMLLVVDRRGYTPLSYVKRDQWGAWHAFIDAVKDKYWPTLQG